MFECGLGNECLSVKLLPVIFWSGLCTGVSSDDRLGDADSKNFSGDHGRNLSSAHTEGDGNRGGVEARWYIRPPGIRHVFVAV